MNNNIFEVSNNNLWGASVFPRGTRDLSWGIPSHKTLLQQNVQSIRLDFLFNYPLSSKNIYILIIQFFQLFFDIFIHGFFFFHLFVQFLG
ncbi:MAG: hypothetical protein UU93_C0013G0029 [Candidatus Amesbacteria bacterium GW2011_GWA2_42_12]|uniref:Uncharacterized protein n=1 Tax=Candidatus Amesbacteria bacterium GW2011_GWA2_42_12 TaxID=1618356 RepID=A0A0G0Y548_9BACT|nr:MAG: hypothetical protein UU93_C0013G0029 [Candidatus Amesbacteria bacterium GW2011_GWA2_42_12]